VKISEREAFVYFRLGLATGLVERQDVIAWADQAILQSAFPSAELIELSLSSKLSYSQMIRLLSSFHAGEDQDLPVKLIFARAWVLLEQAPERTVEIFQGVRLVNAEFYLSAEIRRQINDLENALTDYRENSLSQEGLYARVNGFLAQYVEYQSLLAYVTG
jgi:hypothetical protein